MVSITIVRRKARGSKAKRPTEFSLILFDIALGILDNGRRIGTSRYLATSRTPPNFHHASIWKENHSGWFFTTWKARRGATRNFIFLMSRVFVGTLEILFRLLNDLMRECFELALPLLAPLSFFAHPRGFMLGFSKADWHTQSS